MASDYFPKNEEASSLSLESTMVTAPDEARGNHREALPLEAFRDPSELSKNPPTPSAVKKRRFRRSHARSQKERG
jgi:hypothetical protein